MFTGTWTQHVTWHLTSDLRLDCGCKLPDSGVAHHPLQSPPTDSFIPRAIVFVTATCFWKKNVVNWCVRMQWDRSGSEDTDCSCSLTGGLLMIQLILMTHVSTTRAPLRERRPQVRPAGVCCFTSQCVSWCVSDPRQRPGAARPVNV